jgi:predicted nucleic-acid-binding protein
MLAVDTNILVRLLVEDDSKQFRLAFQLLRTEEVWVSKTVLLETEWVLRSTYGYDSSRVWTGLNFLLGLEQVSLEDRPSVAKALDWMGLGLDFPDALNVASSPDGTGFVTFDRKLVNRARQLGLNVVLLG